MDVLLSFNLDMARKLTPHLHDIALALVATMLVIFGDHVNRTIKRTVSSWFFLARITAFVLMCTFGYGLLTLWGQPLIYWLLTQLSLEWRPAIVLLSFVFLGILAERKRYL